MVRIEVMSWDEAHERRVRFVSRCSSRSSGVPIEIEWDDQDATSLHALAYSDAGDAIATGRLLPDGHIGRMAVLKESRGQRRRRSNTRAA
jgi:hypothetical protein